MIGSERVGSGPLPVVVLHDWMSDTSSWDLARPWLDLERFTWCFADLRGYGRSKGLAGEHTLAEATGDVLALADAGGWARFSVVGHSMSSLVALHLAQRHGGRVERAVLVTPPPPAGLGVDDATVAWLRAAALGDDAHREAGLRAAWGDRLTERWRRFKLARWRETADPEAAAGYVAMFARGGVPDPGAPVAAPMLAVTGERDAEVMRAASVAALLAPVCPRLTVTSLADCGHYPMQESPPLFAAVVERFLAGGG